MFSRGPDRSLPRRGFSLARGAAALLFFFLSAPWPATGQAFSLLYEFSGRGGSPAAGLVRGEDGKLYGTLSSGGNSGYGSVYVLTPDGSGGYSYSELYAAVAADGAIGFSTALLEASDGRFYGGTYFPDGGVIYRVDGSGNFAVVHTFTGNEGSYPGSLIQPGSGDIFGVTAFGGSGGGGTAFRMDGSGNVTVLHEFVGPEGRNPGVLVLAADGFLYGETGSGGSSGRGTVYRMDLSGSVTLLHDFTGPDGSGPSGLIEGTDGFLYGTTSSGGTFDRGTIFRIDTAGTLTTLHSLASTEGSIPVQMIEGSDGNFYGVTLEGGAADAGTLFRVDSAGSFATLHEFSEVEGTRPASALLEDGGRLVGTALLGGAGGFGTVFAADFSGTLQVVYSFLGPPEGSAPVGGLLQASDGLLYGTAAFGGDSGRGTIFRLDLPGNLTRLHSFDGPADGGSPDASLIQASDGDLYGTASAEGPGGRGTLYRISTAGLFTMLHGFSGADGDWPHASLVEAADGDYYGTTLAGGEDNLGTVFRIDGSGVFATLHEFSGPDGAAPYAGLVQAADGRFYGTTVGSFPSPGNVFRMEASGAITTLHLFGSPEGGTSGGGLLLASDGNFYGATGSSVFRIDPAGNFSVLRSFLFGDGISYPGDLVEGSDGNFYGTGLGDKLHRGDVFRVDPAGNLTIIHRFSGPDGGDPRGRLIQAADGYFYGTADYGGEFQGGVVYRFDPAAVVSIASVAPDAGPSAGGTSLTIAGTQFQPGATVKIGYVAAGNVNVSGSTEITAEAPALSPGAAYDVYVNNPDGSLASLARSWFADALDVGPKDLFHDAIATLFHNGISVGCGGGLYCVDAALSRAQMAVLLLKAKLGWGYVPLPATGTVFTDVPADGFAAAYIEDLSARGISAGCGGGNYCPNAPISRAEMAPLLLKTLLGSGYAPPPTTGTVFDDVPVNAFAAAFIEDIAARGIAAGCSAAPPLFCPDASATRGQMAALVVATFGLP